MDIPARALGEPVADSLRLVGCVVVRDDVDVEAGRHIVFYVVEKLAKLLATAEALADHLAGGDVEGCEQGSRAVALVVVGPPFRLPWAQRQQRLRAVLHLAFLVDAQHRRPLQGRGTNPRCPAPFRRTAAPSTA